MGEKGVAVCLDDAELLKEDGSLRRSERRRNSFCYLDAVRDLAVVLFFPSLVLLSRSTCPRARGVTLRPESEPEPEIPAASVIHLRNPDSVPIVIETVSEYVRGRVSGFTFQTRNLLCCSQTHASSFFTHLKLRFPHHTCLQERIGLFAPCRLTAFVMGDSMRFVSCKPCPWRNVYSSCSVPQEWRSRRRRRRRRWYRNWCSDCRVALSPLQPQYNRNCGA